VSTSGLSSVEAETRLREGGRNEVTARGHVTVWTGLLAQLRDPLILVLLAACVLTVGTGDLTDAIVIAVVVVANSTVGLVQEIRADRAITALTRLSAPTVRARRGGVEMSVPSAEIVAGDVILLGEGDIVPADGEVLEASGLLVDESSLTGESVPVGPQARGAERAGDDVSAGTVVVKGRAVVEVSRTGAGSALGQITALMDTRPQPTPLQRRLAGLGKILALAAVGLSALVLLIGLVRGEPTELMIVTAVSLAVAAVPESLPAVVTLALALSARRMAAHHAIVRRLPAVETLGSVSVLATDKTGTLTQSQMVVGELWTPSRSVVVTGQGYEPAGVLISGTNQLEPGTAPDVAELLQAAALCNDATLVTPTTSDGSWTGLGDPTEVALLAAAGKFGMSRKLLERDYPRIAEVPFDSQAQRMTTVHALPGERAGSSWVIVKGSPEALHATHVENGHDDDSQGVSWRHALKAAAAFAERGYRVLAIAAARVASPDLADTAALRLLGLLAIDDPAKPAAESTIRACRSAGIVPVLITGDHPATARSIARSVGILSEEQEQQPELVVTGQQMRDGTVKNLTIPRVFARTNPAQKLAIVAAWQARGASVAMTGDGVNDGPALRRADVGVAMGHRGTEVARQAADLVLADDELGTLVPAVEEGRRVYANIRRFLLFGLSGGTAEILVMLVGPFIGLTVPLLAAQILWINLLTHGLTGVALGAEPAGVDAMTQPPRPPEQSVLGHGLWQRVLAIASVLGSVALGIGVWAHATDRPWRSLIFLSLIAVQLGVAVGLRPRLITRQNLFLPVAVTGSLVLALAGLYIPLLQHLLGTQGLSASEALIGLGTAVLGWAAARASQRLLPQPGQTPKGSEPRSESRLAASGSALR
jgi:Ca2+-transporting ATPase